MIEEICKKLQDELNKNLGIGTCTVGYGENTIYVYEHKRGFAKRRVRPDWIPAQFEVIYKYIGKVSAL